MQIFSFIKTDRDYDDDSLKKMVFERRKKFDPNIG